MSLNTNEYRDLYLVECESLGATPTEKGFNNFRDQYQEYDVQKMLEYGGIKFYDEGHVKIGFPNHFSGFVEYNVSLKNMFMYGCIPEDRAIIQSWRV